MVVSLTKRAVAGYKCHDLTGLLHLLCQRDTHHQVGIAAQTILLAAVEAGLGGLMIGNFNAEALSSALSLPSHLVPQLVLALGKPAETVVLTEAEPGVSLAYYRDAEDVHYVPKRRLEDVVIE